MVWYVPEISCFSNWLCHIYLVVCGTCAINHILVNVCSSMSFPDWLQNGLWSVFIIISWWAFCVVLRKVAMIGWNTSERNVLWGGIQWCCLVFSKLSQCDPECGRTLLFIWLYAQIEDTLLLAGTRLYPLAEPWMSSVCILCFLVDFLCCNE